MNVGEKLKEMIEQNVRDEEGAIKLYKQIIQKAREAGDTTTAKLFEQILGEEEEHHDFFAGILEEI